MSDAPLTLKDMFATDPSKPIADQADIGALLSVVTAATAVLPPAVGSTIVAAFRQALDEVLQLNLGDVLQASWGKAAALRDAILATLKDPESVALVPLLDHKITSTHKPHIDLMLGTKCLARITLDVSLNLALKGVMLEVQRGRIAGLKAGHCLGDGVLAYADKPLITHKTPEIPLPGRLKFTLPAPDESKAVPQAAV
ncbi:MAG: hypothetical protein HY243_03680 [Proteobacteria bacterium]|nr:hypothetical protein [Pseudomonadota bacterium]